MGGKGTGGRPVAAAAARAGAPLALMGRAQGQTGGVMHQPRNLIAPDTLTGEVIEWNDVGGFGWVRAFAEIDHPEAQKRGGKIFIHKKDLAPQVTPELVGTGSMIQFKVYADNRGLGACEVQPL
uniref:CSD domain-containing protein n=1 Tax=Alexandrium catenella TaxID=2925 RepID=A0A7S1W4N5_ALECA